MKKSLVVALLAVAASASHVDAAKVLLRVNDRGITDVSITLAMRYAVKSLRGKPEGENALLRMTVEQSIVRTLLAEEARKAGITVTKEEVAARVAHKRNQLVKPEIIDKVLADLHGSEADVSALEEEMLLADRFVETKVVPTVKVGEAEARAYYDAHPKEFEHPEQVDLRMIMVALRSNATAEEVAAAKLRAEEALARCRKGDDFAAVASSMSDDPSHDRGGHVGWVRKGLLFPELEPAVFALEPGQVSGVLQSPRGFHIFRLEGRRGAGIYPWDEVRERLISMLRTRSLQESLAKIVGPLRSGAKIEFLDPTIEAAMKETAAPGAPAAKP